MKRLVVLIIALFAAAGLVKAQKQSNVWYFGQKAGIDFNGGTPLALSGGVINQAEGCASIADPLSGQLLFYTDGITVWNRTHRPMPGGNGSLWGHPSSTQSALILPKPRSASEYYVFSSDAGEYINPPNIGIHYSIVDMRQDGGLGDVTVRNIPLLVKASEKLTAIQHCNGTDAWVLAHDWEGDGYYAYAVTKYGISAPVVTHIGVRQGVGAPRGDPYSNAIGYLVSSSNGKRLASAIYGSGIIELFDFDNRTGKLSNLITLSVNEIAYGVSFSPDGTKLYATMKVGTGSNVGDPNAVAQFDLRSGQQSAIQASQTVVGSDGKVGMMGLQLGPDGKIYVARVGDSFLGVINNPNALGNACNFQVRGMNLGTGQCQQGLPNMITTYYDPTVISCRPPSADFTRSDTIICQGKCITYTDRSIDNPTRWEWSFEAGSPASFSGKNPPQVCYASPGTFSVRLISSNDNGADTAVKSVQVVPLPGADAGPDLSICIGESRKLNAAGNGTYQWTGQGLNCTTCQSPVATPKVTTTYRLVVTNSSGCQSIDSVTITVSPYPKADAGSDVTICQGESTQLSNNGAGGYQWSPAAGLSCTDCQNPVANPTVTTVYKVVVTNPSGCSSIDSVRVRVVPPPVADAGPDRFICLEENATLSGSGGGSYLWTPSDGLNCTTCRNPVAMPTSTTTYHLTVTGANGCTSTDSTTVHVNRAPRLARVHIDNTYTAFPGTGLKIPVTLDDALDEARISDFLFTLHYQPGMLRLENGGSENLSLLIGGTLTDGWSVNVIQMQDGLFSARFTAPPGSYLKGTGALMNLRFLSFLYSATISPLPFEMELTGAECTSLIRNPGMVRLDSICGLNLRLIQGGEHPFSLAQNSPNPFGAKTTIQFSLGLDGPTTLEVFNASGQKVVTLLNSYMTEGAHSVIWNAQSYPSGIYYIRITSGYWGDEKRMVKQ